MLQRRRDIVLDECPPWPPALRGRSGVAGRPGLGGRCQRSPPRSAGPAMAKAATAWCRCSRAGRPAGQYLAKQLNDFFWMASARTTSWRRRWPASRRATCAAWRRTSPGRSRPGHGRRPQSWPTRAKVLYDDGNVDTGVPACVSCHQPKVPAMSAIRGWPTARRTPRPRCRPLGRHPHQRSSQGDARGGRTPDRAGRSPPPNTWPACDGGQT